MTYKLSQITKELTVDFNGNDIDIDGIHTLREATASQLSFFVDAKYASELPHTKAAAVFIDEEHAGLLPATTIALVTDEVYLKLALASKFFAYKVDTYAGGIDEGSDCDIDPQAVFGRDVILGDNVTIMAGVYVGDNVTIGSNTCIHPNVTLYHGTHIGENCIIHAGAVVGSDGYGFAHTEQGKHIKIYQNGHVEIGDNVEIGANSTVDRATFGATVIGSGTKIDNLVQVAHNCELGEDCLLVCQTALAGSTVLEDGVIMGGQSGATGHLRIGKDAVIASRAGVTKSLPGAKVYGGFPAIEQKLWLKMQAVLLRLIKKK